MTYHPHPPHSMPSAPRREYAPQQQSSRASLSCNPSHTPAASLYDDELTRAWNPQHSYFAPPKLPTPRNLPAPANHHAYREPTPAQAVHADAYRPSTRDGHFQGHDERPSFQGEAGRFSAESHSRPRPTGYSDQLTTPYAQPPPLATYTRPLGPAVLAVCSESSGRDASGQAEAWNRSHAQDRLRGEPDLYRHHGGAPAAPTASYPDSRSERFGVQQSHPRPQHNVRQGRRPSSVTFAPGPLEEGRRYVEPSCAAFSPSRPQIVRKRSLAFDHQPDVESQHSALPRPYSSSGPALQQPDHFPAAQVRQSIAAADDQHPVNGFRAAPFPQQRDGSIQRPIPTSADAVAASGAPPSVMTGHSSIAAQPNDVSATSHHPLQPNRKRLRISRACDECRRRKTRCDIVGAFPGEPGHPLTISGAVPPLEPNEEPKGEMLILQPCMNCRRSEVTCSYSKRPLKRGPSKGYIKDLERRLNSLESQFVAGERAEADHEENVHEFAYAPASGTQQGVKPKIRTEDRISRLESVLTRPTTAKSEEGIAASNESSRRSSEVGTTQVKSEDDMITPLPDSAVDAAMTNTVDSDVATLASALSSDAGVISTTDTAASSVTPKQGSSPESVEVKPKPVIVKDKGKGKLKRRSTTRSPIRVPDDDTAEVKNQVITSCLHATFPIVPARPQGESSKDGGSASSIARLEDRVLARGLKLLTEPVEMATAHQESQNPKSRAHAARVANLIGQASAGLGGPRDELMQQARAGNTDMRALRKVSHRLSGQEADLLMLCHLDHLRNGRNNNSALAAAVSKLGSGSHVQNDRETYRRRTLLFMLDRWHAIAFGTPHLLMGRFGMERHSFRSMKEALGDVSQSALGDAVYEVLRCAIMLGQLNDLVQNNGGWKGISKSDVDAVIHSAMDDDERPTTSDSDLNGGSSSAEASSSQSGSSADDASQKLLSTEALRYSLESLVRCYHALHTLPNAKDVTMDDLHRMFNLAEAVLVLGTAKTPVSLQGKLIRSAIGPHVLAVAGVAFSWCLRIICMMVASSLSSDSKIATPPTQDAPSSSKDTTTTVPVSTSSLPLEFYRRKILDYVRMCGPFCLFSGGPPTSPASFAPVYLRLALYFNSTVSFASQLGSLVSPQSKTSSPVHLDPLALGNEADNVLDMAREIGFLGYVLAGTSQGDAWSLLTGPTTA